MDFNAETDYLYSPSNFSPRGKACVPAFIERVTKYSEKFRNSHNEQVETVRYGDGPQQIMDIVRPLELAEETPITLIIHGGYWVETSRDMYLYTAEHIVEKGRIAVIVGYDQAPNVSLTTIVQQIRESYLFLCQKFPKCKALTVTGHSAGGHLSSMLIATKWEEKGQDRNLIPIRRCVPVAGLPDIRPVACIKYNEDLKLTSEELLSLSPVLLTEIAAKNCQRFGTKVISVVGQNDSPAFIQNSKDYTQTLVKAAVDAEFLELPGLDHYEIMEKLSEPDYALIKILVDED